LSFSMPWSALLIVSFGILLFVCELNGQQPDFILAERFGVYHPIEPLEFNYSGSSMGYKLMKMNGVEEPFQQLSNGDILIRTYLPPSSLSRTYPQYGN